MNRLELKSLVYWYIMFFKCRLTNYKKGRKKLTCYIFANKGDMEEYCKINNIDCTKYMYDSYLLINEEEKINLVAIKITNVVLVSSNVAELVKGICETAKETENIGFKCLIEEE